jgi:diacylglycerol kinase family enzyme
MQPHELAASLMRILERSPAFPGERLSVDLIANPKAGGFTRSAYAKKRHAELAGLEAEAAALPARAKVAAATLRVHLTERCGHAGDIARSLIAEARGDGPGVRRIVMTAGGDGTALETASALVDLPPAERGRFSILRLPMGTGNDGSEGRDLKACLGRLLKPVVSAPRRAIRVRPNPAGGRFPLYSFNIASLGLDAFVCQMTNRLKTAFPGDSYKFWVDVASVFYDRAWPPAPLAARAYDAAGKIVRELEEKCELFAMGASGRRQYGANKPILPDDDNVCAVFQMSTLKKLALKDRLASGGHRGLGPEIVQLFTADRVEFKYDRGILLQRDGEVDELSAADFPLVMELTEPCYNVLEPA